MSDDTGQSAEIEDVRARLRRFVDEHHAGNLAGALKGSDLNYATTHAWSQGKYQGRNDRVASDVKIWLDTREERMRAAATLPKAPPFIETNSARAFLEALTHAHHAPDLVIITGGPGVGKTSAATHYDNRNSGVVMITGQPSIRTPRALLDELAEALEIRDRGPSQRVAKAILRRLTGQPRLVLVDEAQHLSTEALDQLRTIHDIANVGVALVGNETIYPRLEGVGRTAEFAQLFSRIGMRVPRPKPLRSDVDAILDAWGISGDRERKVLHAIARKPGALRSVTKVLRQAKMAATLDGSGEPSTQHLHDAYARLSSSELSMEEAA